MLVLNRRFSEKVMIGDDITITVVNIGRDKVRLGFEAPRELPVHRREVYERIKAALQQEKEKQNG